MFQPRRPRWGACQTAKVCGTGCVCARGVLMCVVVCRVCECISGGADCGGVFQPKCGMAGEEVRVQVPLADGDYVWLVNLLAFDLIDT